MERTILIPMSDGSTREVTGNELGSFLVHKDPIRTATIARGNYDIWQVTLTHTGVKFPVMFLTRTAAERFALEVEEFFDWPSVEVARGDGPATEWLTQKPSQENLIAIALLADSLGGVIIA